MADKVKYAAKTALSLTLAYLIPMALGWSQPQTAAITVMLIAATGALSESLQKGIMRTLGTVAGAIIGLSLIALFPQDRLAYLAAISVVVTVLIYLYNAYQGDSTVFMLTMVVSLMVFNGGDADGAFVYGVDRTLLTAFGVLVYSLVGSFLWPVSVENNIERLAAAVSAAYARAGTLLASPAADPDDQAAALDEVLSSLQQFRTRYAAVKNDADRILAYQSEWNAIMACYEQLEAIVVPALRSRDTATPEYARVIANYPQVLENLAAMLGALEHCWQQDEPAPEVASIDIAYNSELLQRETHLGVAAIVSHGELLVELQAIVGQLTGAVCSLRFDSGRFSTDQVALSAPSFIWFDRENLKTALRGFFTFWFAAIIWIQYNPPGGFMFVTLCTALVPLISFTPVTPKLLIFLFSFGFLFAVPAYVFLLPGMTHWVQLALFLFGYAFVGFFIFPGPVSIFFLLGLFTLGIQNTMSYNFNVLALVILMFYLVCGLLIVSAHFPFTSKPQRLYGDFRRRFLRICAKIIRTGPPQTALRRAQNRVRLTAASALIGKMQQWGPMIDSSYFTQNPAANISAFTQSCDGLLSRLRVLTGPNNRYAENPVVANARRLSAADMAASLCDILATEERQRVIAQAFDDTRTDLKGTEHKLGNFLEQDRTQVPQKGSTGDYSSKDMADFYLYIHLRVSILRSIDQCREALVAVNWQQLRETKF